MSDLTFLSKEPAHQPDVNTRLRWRPDPFLPAAREHALSPGVTLLQGVSEVLKANNFHAPLSVIDIWVADNEYSPLSKIPRAEWATRLIRHGEFIQVTMPVQGGGGGGGKNPLRTILMIVVAVVATVASAYTAGALSPLMAPAWATAIGGLAGAVISVGGMLLVNKIAPVSTPKLGNNSAGTPGKIWSIDGIQNRADLYNMVPLVLGRARFAPRYAAQPYTLLKNGGQYARYLFCVAGRNKVSDIRIGDTPIDNFRNAECKVHDNWRGEKLEYFPSAIFQEDLGIELKSSNGYFYRTTTSDCSQLQYELYFGRGLCLIDNKNRRHNWDISFQPEYRKVGDTEWKAPPSFSTVTPVSSTTASMSAFKFNTAIPLYLDNAGRVTFDKVYKSTKDGWTGYDRVGTFYSTGVVKAENVQGVTFSINPRYVTAYHGGDDGTFQYFESFTVTMTAQPGALLRRKELTVWGATLTPFRRGYVIPLDGEQCEFRIRRTSWNSDPNDTNQTILDDSIWSVFRSEQRGEVVKYDGAPLTLIELEIQANEQLNGHVQELNAIFESFCPVWDGEKWVEEASSNAAAVAMLVCTSPHIHRIGVKKPYDMLNLQAWQGFYEWCEEMGWTYNSIQTGQETVRHVLYNVLAAARASITFSNGKLGVAWDSTDKPTAYPFGPRNSWGFKASKTFVIEQPHGLRVRFLNEDCDYQEDERIVYADGYDHTNATNIVEMEFDGVTNPELIYKHARLRLADSIWRPETYEFSTDFAYLCVDKGDRIQVTHDTPMWGVRQARVQDIKYADYPLEEMSLEALKNLARQHQNLLRSGLTTQEFMDYLDTLEAGDIRRAIAGTGIKNTALMAGIVLDDIVSMESDKEYSLKCYVTGSTSSTYSIMPEDTSTNELTLYVPIPASQAPAPGALAHFGYSGRETHDLIVVGIDTGDELNAQIYAQDYSAEQIYAAMTGPVPPWSSDVTLLSRWQLGKLSAPSVTRIATDEYVLLALNDGTLIPRIQVTYALHNHPGIAVQKVLAQVRPKDGGEEWREAGQALGTSNVLYIDGVEEQVTYELRLYAISSTGVSSEFSPVYEADVVGRTTPPPAPTAVHIDGCRIWWEMPDDYPIDVRGWEVFMGFDDTAPFDYAIKISSPYATSMEFDIARWSGWSRRVWVRSIDDAGLTSEPVSVAINLGEQLLNNVVFEIAENAQRGWPGIVTDGSLFDGRLMPSSSVGFWDTKPWAREDFWLSGQTNAMTYETELKVPEEAIQSYLTVQIDMPYGILGSVEYMTDGMVNYAPMPNEIYIENQTIVKLRVTTREATHGVIQEIKWIFDVEDQFETINDLQVPEDGVRLPLKEAFRWVTSLVFGLEWHDGAQGAKVVWLDKGIIENGIVTQGPLIEVHDNAGTPVVGIVDITIQGAKGVSNG